VEGDSIVKEVGYKVVETNCATKITLFALLAPAPGKRMAAQAATKHGFVPPPCGGCIVLLSSRAHYHQPETTLGDYESGLQLTAVLESCLGRKGRSHHLNASSKQAMNLQPLLRSSPELPSTLLTKALIKLLKSVLFSGCIICLTSSFTIC
jgi:hypothetical protein